MTIVLGIVIFFLVVQFALGMYAGLKHPVKDFEDWATAGRSFGYVVNFFTAHATQVSALTYMGFVTLMYTFGPSAYFSHYISYMLTTCAFFVLFSPRIWKLGKRFAHVTPTEMLAQYYGGGKWFSYIVGTVLVLGLIPYIQLQVTAAGYLGQLATGGKMSLWVGAIAVYVLITVYTWLGGIRAVAWTDVLQCSLLLIGLYVGAILITNTLGGGFGNVISQMTAKNPQMMTISGYKGWDYRYVISWGVALGAGFAFHAHMWLRNYSPKSEWDARTWPSVMFTVNIINGIVLLFAGMSLFLAFPGKAGAVADQLFLSTIAERFSPWVFGIMISGAMGALLSSLDSQVHALSVVVTRDFVNASGKRLDDKGTVVLNRWVVVIAMGLGLFLSWAIPNVLAVIGGYAAALGLLIAPAVVGALTGQRWITRTGVIWGIVFGLVGMVATSGNIPALAGLKNYWNLFFGFWGFAVNVVVMAVVSLATASEAPSKEMADLYTGAILEKTQKAA